MPRRKPSGSHTVSGLRRRCAELEHLLLHPTRPLASSEEVRAAKPGGADNPYQGHAGWIECFALLKGYMRRIEVRETQRDGTEAQLEAIVRDAAARKPIPVELSIGTRHVHQKSAWALHYLDSLEALVRPLFDMAKWAAERVDDEAQELKAFPDLLHGTARRVWAWILLHEGVGLPFGDTDDVEPPAWTAELLHEDFAPIYVAHQQMHHTSVMTMALAMQGGAQPNESRLKLHGFLAGYGQEQGIRPADMVRQWGYPESVAGAFAAFEAHRVAEANAKAKSAAGGRAR